MMKSKGIVFSLLGVLGLCSATALAGGGGEVTLTGKIMCAKCSLKETPKCTTAIQVKEGGKTVTYYLLDKGAAEEYHEPVCGSGTKDGKVIGTVSVKDGKKWITPKKVEYTAAKDAMHMPRWIDDYGMARMEGKKEGKPLAIFVGKGPEGWQKLSRDGILSDSVQHCLMESYVPLYIDAATPAGSSLAQAFALPGGLGIVISDRTGELQAFYHAGDLAPQALGTYLMRYAAPSTPVRTTVTNPGDHDPHAGMNMTGGNGQSTAVAPAPGFMRGMSAPAAGGCCHR